MKLRNFILAALVALLSFGFSAKGETVSHKQARAMAQAFFNAARGQVLAEPSLVYNGKKLTTDRLFTPFYVFNHPAGGWVIIAADNKAFPILAYDLEGSFDPSQLSPSQLALLAEYARDIELIRYDARTPELAIRAWTNFPNYVSDLLKQPYVATDALIEPEEAREKVYNVVRSAREDLFSDLFSYDQWMEMIDAELSQAGNVALGIIAQNGDVEPTVIHGRKGDYYRLTLGQPNKSLYRLLATEFLTDGQLAALASPLPLPEPAEEAPFAYVDSYTRAAESPIQTAIESIVAEAPTLQVMGSGKYMVTLPRDAAMANIYNLAGSLVRRYLYKGSPQAAVDLMGEPGGFYFLQVIDVDGNPYGFKIIR